MKWFDWSWSSDLDNFKSHIKTKMCFVSWIFFRQWPSSFYLAWELCEISSDGHLSTPYKKQYYYKNGLLVLLCIIFSSFLHSAPYCTWEKQLEQLEFPTISPAALCTSVIPKHDDVTELDPRLTLLHRTLLEKESLRQYVGNTKTDSQLPSVLYSHPWVCQTPCRWPQ